jgi:hypothetical protein
MMIMVAYKNTPDALEKAEAQYAEFHPGATFGEWHMFEGQYSDGLLRAGYWCEVKDEPEIQVPEVRG